MDESGKNSIIRIAANQHFIAFAGQTAAHAFLTFAAQSE